ncbi:hypothetical protein GQ600_247 [Phytophthora cactorum]|nr:hypothetical protein GQ600_247 [Phytophthora cactorum]
MKGYFSDNQTKQKAYDRYYNAMAKSDFVQGSKLKALIQQESLDDASADSLANLFQQVMAKTREYDYDMITQKLAKAVPEIVKGKPKKAVKVQMPSKKKKSTKVKFVPQVTDTDVTMATPPSRKSSSEKNFEQEMSENDMIMASPPRSPQAPPQTPRTPQASSQAPSQAPSQESFHPPVTMNIRKRVSSEDDNYFDDLFGADSTIRIDKDEVNEKIETNGDSEALNDEIFTIGQKAVAEESESKSKVRRRKIESQ